MYPNLSYLLHDLFGTARDNGFSIIQMFGFFLGATFFVSAYVVHKELQRKEREGLLQGSKVREIVGGGARLSDMISSALFGFVFGMKFPGILMDFSTFKEDAAGYIFSGQGSVPLGLLGAIVMGLYTYWDANRKKLDKPKEVTKMLMPSQRIGDITVIAAIFGILGGRLFSILENLDVFWQDPIGQLTSGSGLTVYGGIILAFAAVYYYVSKHGIRPIHVMDIFGPVLTLGYAIGRMGCQVSGDGDWGIVNTSPKPSWFIFPDWAWAYDYPHNVLNEGVAIADCVDKYCHRLDPAVFPTPLYEIVASLLIFGLLWFLRKKIRLTGIIFFLYAILMSIERFFIEFIRVNPRYEFMGMHLSQAQWISVGLFVGGIIGVLYWWRRHEVQTPIT